MPRTDALLPIGLLLALALLTFWLGRAVKAPNKTTSVVAKQEQDAIVDKFVARQYGPDGSIRYTLTARKMLHYSDDDSSVFEDVRFEGQETRQQPFVVTAPRGRTTSKGTNVYFEGDVVAVQQGQPQTPALTVRTTFLHLIPQSGIAQTDQPVIIERENSVLHAAGMQLNNQTMVATLTHVKATLYSALRR